MNFRNAIELTLMASGCVFCFPACAEHEADQNAGFQTDVALETWAYMTSISLNTRSTLNPGNAIAQLPSSQRVADTRFNLKVRGDIAEMVLQPRFLAEQNRQSSETDSDEDIYLSQAFIRVRPGQRFTLTGGRYRFVWGPANFRSPGNPFYFDSGKNQPLRDVPGVDLLRVDYSLGDTQITAAYVADAARLSGRPDIEDIVLLKSDLRGRDWHFSALGNTRPDGKFFFGAFGQYAASDAVLLYAEYGRGQRPFGLKLPEFEPAAQALESPSKSAASILLGSSYTRMNGQVLSFEYLYDGHGYHREDEVRYFTHAENHADNFLSAQDAAVRGNEARALGLLMSQTPALLGRHYAYFLWQSSPQEASLYWRGALPRNLQDRSVQVLLYADKNVARRVTLFGSATVNHGDSNSEFGAITSRTLSAGVKLFLL